MPRNEKSSPFDLLIRLGFVDNAKAFRWLRTSCAVSRAFGLHIAERLVQVG